MLLLIIGVFGSKVDVAGSSLAGWAVVFAVIATLVIFAMQPIGSYCQDG